MCLSLCVQDAREVILSLAGIVWDREHFLYCSLTASHQNLLQNLFLFCSVKSRSAQCLVDGEVKFGVSSE